jgi:hypothetical protein
MPPSDLPVDVAVLTNFFSQQASSDDNSSEGTPYDEGHLGSNNSDEDMPSQPDVTPSASRKRLASEPVAPRVQLEEGQSVCAKKARQGASGEVNSSCFSHPLPWHN